MTETIEREIEEQEGIHLTQAGRMKIITLKCWLADSRAKDERIKELESENDRLKVLDLRFVKNTKEYKQLEAEIDKLRISERELEKTLKATRLAQDEISLKSLTAEEAKGIIDNVRIDMSCYFSGETRQRDLIVLGKTIGELKRRFNDLFAKKGVDISGNGTGDSATTASKVSEGQKKVIIDRRKPNEINPDGTSKYIRRVKGGDGR